MHLNKTWAFGLVLVLVLSCTLTAAAQRRTPKGEQPTKRPAAAEKPSPADEEAEKEELKAAMALPPSERVEKLRAFLTAHPRSTLKTRASELLVSALASSGDERLQAGDTKGGIERFHQAIDAIPAKMSDNLYEEVVTQIPPNLFLRGERVEALKAARLIEGKVKDNAKRLLVIAAFYVGIEDADDAGRVADAAITLAPDLSPAYQARGAARRIALRLDEAAADYARALELDSNSSGSRRSLADLRRANGKMEEALALYREMLKADPANEFVRTGLVVSLFDLGKKEEAKAELSAALKEMPNSLALLVGMSYWLAAHGEAARAIEFAKRAVDIEPRYVWGHVALARALIAQDRPLEAERALTFAAQYGKFPTLNYELASTRLASGYYEEAAVALSESFGLKNDLIVTRLAGRIPAESTNFIELLALERRASIFQFTAADNDANAKSLKALLAFYASLHPAGGREQIKEADVLAAAQEFTSIDDDMRAHRQLYVASRLLEYKIALPKAVEYTDAASTGVGRALNRSGANSSAAVVADEMRAARARAIVNGTTPEIPELQRTTLSNIMRGRIEDIAGWSLFNQDKPEEANVRLRRAVSVLPENSIWWIDAMWHLGASLAASGKGTEALDAYFKSYKSSGPDPSRRSIIEALYRKVNGSLDGFDERIGSGPVASNATRPVDNFQSATADAKPPVIAEPTPTPVVAESKPAVAEPAPTPVVAESKPAVAEPTPTPVVAESKPEIAEPTPTPVVAESKPAVAEATPSPVVAESKPVVAEPTPTPVIAESKPAVADPAPSPATSESKPATTEPAASEAVADAKPPETQPVDTPKAAETEPNKSAATPTTQEGNEPAFGPPPKPIEDADAKPAAPLVERKRRADTKKCSLTLSESAITLQGNGGSATIALTVENGSGSENVTATTSDWSDIAVFPEPKPTGSDSNSILFSIASVSRKTGTFTVTIKSPCGTKEVKVTVR